MEDLLDKIESEIKQRKDYLQHLRFGNRIVFKSTNNQIHWIIIDSYNVNENKDLQGPFFNGSSENPSNYRQCPSESDIVFSHERPKSLSTLWVSRNLF